MNILYHSYMPQSNLLQFSIYLAFLPVRHQSDIKEMWWYDAHALYKKLEYSYHFCRSKT